MTLGSSRKTAYLNMLLIAAISMLMVWIVLDLLDFYTDIDWVIYTRGYREYLFYTAIILNVVAIILRRRF